jgi:hypothetical protein
LQPLLRRVGGALLARLAQLRLADLAGERPCCPGCGGGVRLVATRPRALVGLVGEVTLQRPYYHCAACKAGMAPLDEAWGLGSGGLTPELARVACRDGIEAAFGEGADLVYENLGVRLDAEAVRGISEAMYALAEADQRDPPAGRPRARRSPRSPRSSWTGCSCTGGRLARDEGGRVAPLGPALARDQGSGGRHLALGRSTYCAGREEVALFWPGDAEVARVGWGRGVRAVALTSTARTGSGARRAASRAGGVALVEI